ncbi:hypothetical protein CXB77_14470 [Chromatium okenii]|uniref:Uncharacterized protein n=1 Tax=Chromatium okenii TaxID=61644 RepID=A0A2S7XNV4_9GAMM|nr:hypothetical protein CXB77_14470 [Chromatium okenii]
MRPLDTPLVATPAPVVSAPVTPIVTTPPVAATDELDALIQAGRLEDAAALVQTRYAAGNPPAPMQSRALIERLGAANKRDAAFTLIRLLANNRRRCLFNARRILRSKSLVCGDFALFQTEP